MKTLSTYESDFKGDSNNDICPSKLSPNSTKKPGIFPNVNPSILQTTKQRDYKPILKKNQIKQEIEVKYQIEPKIGWKGMFSTTYRQSYLDKLNPQPKRKIDVIRHLS